MPKIKIKTKNSENFEIKCQDIQIVPIDSVFLYPNNPRENDDPKVLDALWKSIKRFGQRTPITVCKDTRIIYKGNTTWKSMKRGGASNIAVSFQGFSDKKEKVGYSISDNRLAENTTWDEKKLTSLISENFKGLPEMEAFTGFNTKELEILVENSPVKKHKNQAEKTITLIFYTDEEWKRFQQKYNIGNVYKKSMPYSFLEKQINDEIDEPVAEDDLPF